MKRVHGPYPHGRRWRLLTSEVRGKAAASSFATRDEANAALERANQALLTASIEAVLVASAVAVPANPSWVYFLHDTAGAIVYVGVAASLRDRIAEHRKEKAGFARATCFPRPLPRTDALRIGTALVRALSPKLNVKSRSGKSA